MIYQLDNLTPNIAEDCYIAPTATLVGNVTLAPEVSIWFQAVVRADNDSIIIGRGSNIQDGCVLHVDPGWPMVIGERVTVGHKAMLHGCRIGDGTLIGINAVVLNGAIIGKDCLIGANALVTEGMQVPDGSMVLGSPARIKRAVGPAAAQLLRDAADAYIAKRKIYSDGLQAIN